MPTPLILSPFAIARKAQKVLAIVLIASPAAAMLEHVPTIDPLKTSCAGFIKATRAESRGEFALAVDLLPATTGSPVEFHRGDTNLYDDMNGLGTIPVDDESYALIIKHHAPVWLVLSFDPAAPGTVRRNVAFATKKQCRVGESQYISLDAVPLEIRRQLLAALTDLQHGGRGDPQALSDDDSTRISRLFPASIDAGLEQALAELDKSASPKKPAKP
ncbi:hypothetical protein QE369_000747 [Agrobacterium larrymoorei]|uniref:DUF1254 domain-containing protein n=2 Tax=Agrobacterium larrymoorei TaxID=160699 RepID=A0AAJ2EQF2_9HYPH|nr:hypothetical protein [Agrobacterium larrymoorei]